MTSDYCGHNKTIGSQRNNRSRSFLGLAQLITSEAGVARS